jgi:hypothetical protein
MNPTIKKGKMMNINEIDKDDLQDEWIAPIESSGIRTLFYSEFDNGQVFGFWTEFRPNGSEIWADGDKDIVELEKTVVSTKTMGRQLKCTPIEKIVDGLPCGEGLYIEMGFDEQLERNLYIIYTLSVDGKRIYGLPCDYSDDGYPMYIEKDYLCETYQVVDGVVEGFK